MDDRDIRVRMAVKEAAERGAENVAGVEQGPATGSADVREWRMRQVLDQFTYHRPTPDQVARMTMIRQAAQTLALAIVANTPFGNEQETAIANIRAGVMFANASIVCGLK